MAKIVVRNFKDDEIGFCITSGKTRIFRPSGKTTIKKIGEYDLDLGNQVQ